MDESIAIFTKHLPTRSEHANLSDFIHNGNSHYGIANLGHDVLY